METILKGVELTRMLITFKIILVMVVFLSGCATGPRDIETPQGPRPGDQTGPFIILGVISRTTSTLKRSDAKTTFEETVTVKVPPGTQFIIPTVRGWATGYGKTDPENLSAQSGTITFTWNPNDEHFGLAMFNIYVDRIYDVDSTSVPPTQTAQIVVSGILGDENLDNKWWASINYNLLCLGRHP